MAALDDYLFSAHLEKCRYVFEDTQYLEIFLYSDPNLNSVAEASLNPEEFESFFHRRGNFSQPALPDGVSLTASLRLILQQDAKQADTFEPSVISLPPETYSSMVKALHLPSKAIESSSNVGPLFWAALEGADSNPLFQLVFRKADVRKHGSTRGWEVLLSHEMKSGMTTGFCKGTKSADLIESIKKLKACTSDIGHPLLLPLIICSHLFSSKQDTQQREARDWLRRLEHVNAKYGCSKGIDPGIIEGVLELEDVNCNLVECHAQVLWKSPAACFQIIEGINQAMEVFIENLPKNRRDMKMEKLHSSLIARLEFYKRKLRGIEFYGKTTLRRLEVQRSLVSNLIAERESKLNFQIARDQRTIAWASKRDSSAMKTISVLGIVFLPGAFLASIFSTTFFDFQTAPDIASAVSPRFWLYWAVTIPLTLAILVVWFIWETRSARKYEKLERDLEH